MVLCAMIISPWFTYVLSDTFCSTIISSRTSSAEFPFKMNHEKPIWASISSPKRQINDWNIILVWWFFKRSGAALTRLSERVFQCFWFVFDWSAHSPSFFLALRERFRKAQFELSYRDYQTFRRLPNTPDSIILWPIGRCQSKCVHVSDEEVQHRRKWKIVD